MSAFQLAPDVVIDGGNLLLPLGEEAALIDHIFLTHSHLDHICDIPFLIERFFEKRRSPLRVYGLPETLKHLHTHLFCDEIWADFTKIPLQSTGEPAVELVPLRLDERVEVSGWGIRPVPNTHMKGSCGYLVERGGRSILISSDTSYDESLARWLEEDRCVAAIFECSMPNAFAELAHRTGHLTPESLQKQLELPRNIHVKIYCNHMKPQHREKMTEELGESTCTLLQDGDLVRIDDGELVRPQEHDERDSFMRLVALGESLTRQEGRRDLYKTILAGARSFVGADAGTLYLIDEARRSLRFTVVQNDTLDIDWVWDEGEEFWEPLPLYREDGSPNLDMAATAAAVTGETMIVSDLGNGFHGTRRFDERTGYRTETMIAIPLKNHERRVVGVLQLINRIDGQGSIVPFTERDIRVANSLASQISLVMRNRLLVYDMERMLFSFLNALVSALGRKSLHTGSHIRRMSGLTRLVVERMDETKEGTFADLTFGSDEKRAIYLASLVHDIGKIVVPDYLIHKATRLYGPFDRIECLRLRAELVKASAQGEAAEEIRKEVERAYAFLEEINDGRRHLEEEDLRYLRTIRDTLRYRLDDGWHPLLEEAEYEALSVRRGTLTPQERRQVMDHVRETQIYLKELFYPEKYRRVPEIAGLHHEKLNGKGYPDGRKGREIPLEARILAITDVFEALTAPDRPYKRPNTLSEAMGMLKAMAKRGEVDENVVRFMWEKGIVLEYARRYLNPEQLDMEFGPYEEIEER